MRFPHFLLFGVLISLCAPTYIHSEQILEETSAPYSLENYDELLAENYFLKFKKKIRKKKKKFQIADTWHPYFVRNDLIEPVKSYFFQMNLGIGFLRFSGIKGGTSHSGQNTGQILRGPLNYTRTPLFEANLGSKLLEWLSIALAYQHQGVIDIDSEWQSARALTSASQVIDEFKANLRLDALFGKVYFIYPSSLIWKTIAFCPYLGAGFGVSYQSWTNLQVQSQVSTAGANSSHIKSYKNKYSTNAFYMFDLGINMRSARPNLPFSVRMGCKYNGWGQARSMGKKDQQNSSRFLNDPIRIKTVYQFAPYLGVQWNY